MIGVLVNVLSIIIGGVIGLILHKGLNEKIKKVVMQAIGLSVIVIGISGAIITENVLLLVLSLVIGAVIGTLLKIEDRLDQFGKHIETKYAKSNDKFAKGFITASLIYCVGAMAILGSIEAGVQGDNTTLFIKSILDGVTAIIFTATLGYGVIFSGISVFLYQGTIVLLGTWLQDFLTPQMINETSAVGSVLILAIGLNMLELKRIHVGDMLPAVFIPIVWYLISGLF